MSTYEDFIESLLFEDESPTLDFKRDQYPFSGQDKDTKSELLKDILAFTNSWRREDAYVLIGVEEVQEGRSRVVGVSEHLDDAELQQFVNSKTQRPVEFSYSAVQLEGKSVGVIRIALQARPVYLLKNYGRLKKSVVYIRRGSSTAEAAPDEIAEMGALTSQRPEPGPQIALEWASPNERKLYGNAVGVFSTHVEVPQPEDIPDHGRTTSPVDDRMSVVLQAYTKNKDYYRQLAEYFRGRAFFGGGVGLAVTNKGTAVAQDVKVKFRVPETLAPVTFSDSSNLPEEPRSDTFGIAPQTLALLAGHGDLSVEKLGEEWFIRVKIGKVQPKETVWTTGRLFVGASETCELVLDGTVFADNLSDPESVHLGLQVEVKQDCLDLERLIGDEKN